MKWTKPGTRRIFIKDIVAAGSVTLPGLHSLASVPGFKEEENKQKKDLVILFQGDSITDGNRSRNNDWNHLMGHGYAYLIAGRLWCDHPENNLQFINRGVSGNKITDLEARWQADTIDIKPDILSILVGINDVHSVLNDSKDKVDNGRFEEVYRRLLNETKEKLPEVHLVLCEPFILPVGQTKNNWTSWKEEIQKRQETVKQLAGEFNAIFVGFQKAFDEALKKAPPPFWIWDGIHPMPAGHELMARQWIDKLKKKYPFIT